MTHAVHKSTAGQPCATRTERLRRLSAYAKERCVASSAQQGSGRSPGDTEQSLLDYLKRQGCLAVSGAGAPTYSPQTSKSTSFSRNATSIASDRISKSPPPSHRKHVMFEGSSSKSFFISVHSTSDEPPQDVYVTFIGEGDGNSRPNVPEGSTWRRVGELKHTESGKEHGTLLYLYLPTKHLVGDRLPQDWARHAILACDDRSAYQSVMLPELGRKVGSAVSRADAANGWPLFTAFEDCIFFHAAASSAIGGLTIKSYMRKLTRISRADWLAFFNPESTEDNNPPLIFGTKQNEFLAFGNHIEAMNVTSNDVVAVLSILRIDHGPHVFHFVARVIRRWLACMKQASFSITMTGPSAACFDTCTVHPVSPSFFRHTDAFTTELAAAGKFDIAALTRVAEKSDLATMMKLGNDETAATILAIGHVWAAGEPTQWLIVWNMDKQEAALAQDWQQHTASPDVNVVRQQEISIHSDECIAKPSLSTKIPTVDATPIIEIKSETPIIGIKSETPIIEIKSEIRPAKGDCTWFSYEASLEADFFSNEELDVEESEQEFDSSVVPPYNRIGVVGTREPDSRLFSYAPLTNLSSLSISHPRLSIDGEAVLIGELTYYGTTCR